MEAIKTVDQLKYNLTLGPGYGGYSDLLKAVKFDPKALQDYLQFNSETYQRIRIYDSDTVEAVITCWEPGQKGMIHDFHHSLGWFKVLKGAVGVEHYSMQKDEPILRFNYDYPEDTQGFLNDDLGFHRFSNLSLGRSIVLHFYADKIKHWEVYNEKRHQVEDIEATVHRNFDKPA
ncbi:MAG: cysteine dioxygenase family protein [Bacteroidetes bacterium]|nr:cysteine dioxygenase family protein [Bacteroidota bacterium]